MRATGTYWLLQRGRLHLGAGGLPATPLGLRGRSLLLLGGRRRLLLLQRRRLLLLLLRLQQRRRLLLLLLLQLHVVHLLLLLLQLSHLAGLLLPLLLPLLLHERLRNTGMGRCQRRAAPSASQAKEKGSMFGVCCYARQSAELFSQNYTGGHHTTPH